MYQYSMCVHQSTTTHTLLISLEHKRGTIKVVHMIHDLFSTLYDLFFCLKYTGLEQHEDEKPTVFIV